MTRKSILRSVRLDDDVWEAVKAMDISLNQYLRTALLGEGSRIRLLADSARRELESKGLEFTLTDAMSGEDLTPSLRSRFKGPILKPREKK